MKSIWRKFHKLIHPHEWDDVDHTVEATSKPNRNRVPVTSRDRDRKTVSASVSHPESFVACPSRHGGNFEVLAKQRSQSLPTVLPDPRILLSSPEHRQARHRQPSLEAAIYRELQQSKVSPGLQDLTFSDEAGQKPYCEDVEDSNTARRRRLFEPALKIYSSSQRSAYGNDHLLYDTQHIPSHLTPIADTSPEELHASDRGRVDHLSRAPPQWNPHTNFNTPPTTDRRSRSMQMLSTHSALQPVTKGERRHSLTHKPNIFDLRNTFESGHFFQRTDWSRRYHSGSEQSRRSSIKRSRLDMPLPPTPAHAELEASQQGHSRLKPAPTKYQYFTTRSGQQPYSTLPSSGSRREDTTVYERWAPAVTHETITRKIHEVREEHIHKEIHKYHVNHRIQPVIDYEILPPRHFIKVDGGYQEISEKDLPAEVPSAEWFNTEVASKLESAASYGRPLPGSNALLASDTTVDDWLDSAQLKTNG